MSCARSRIAAIVLAVCILLAPQPTTTRTASAQGDPPAPGAVVFEDALTTTSIFRASACPSGRGTVEAGADGLTVRTTGRCLDSLPQASMHVFSFNALVPDGEIEVETRITAGQERAYVILHARIQADGGGYALLWHPAGGVMQLVTGYTEDEDAEILAEQTGLPVPAPGAWTRLALRFDGDRIWALLDGKPVLTAVDDLYDDGGMLVAVARRPNGLGLGPDPDAAPFEDMLEDLNTEDREEVAVTLRNLRVSALAGGVEARKPTVQTGTARRVPPMSSQFVPAPGTPPVPSDTIVEQALDGPGMFRTLECPTRRGSVVTVGEGLMLKANGRCVSSVPFVGMGIVGRGLTLADGEVQVEVKAVNGGPRVSIGIDVRWGENRNDGYTFGLAPASGLAAIARYENGASSILARRTDLQPVLAADDWNTLTVRVRGADLWLLVNDRPALRATDERFSRGGLALTLQRRGDESDSQEVAAVFRNLRVSALKDAPEDRRPTYVAP